MLGAEIGDDYFHGGGAAEIRAYDTLIRPAGPVAGQNLRILGISPLDKDATACLYVDGGTGRRWWALAEERLSRIKLHKGFPGQAVEMALKRGGLSAADVDAVVYPFRSWWVEGMRMAGGFARDLPFVKTNGQINAQINVLGRASRRAHLGAYLNWCARGIGEHRRYHRELNAEIRKLGLINRLHRIEHHRSHAAGAWLTSGFESALALSLDWYGGGLSGSVSEATPTGLRVLREFRYPHSLGLFYAQVTSALGFRASRHEGKIVGLAAFGNPGLLGPAILERFRVTDGAFRYINAMDSDYLRDLVDRHSREDVAAGCQYALEEVVCDIVRYWLERTGLSHVVLSGGVTANVKMNQRIADIEGVERVFIHPAMGDGGTCVGAVLAWMLDRQRVEPVEWESCYLGPDYTEADVRDALSAERHRRGAL